MGKLARVGVFCLMGLAIVVARLVEVELEPAQAATQPGETRAGSGPALTANALAPEAPPIPAAEPPAPAPPKERGYIVQQGDTLGDISRKAYGTTRHWERILDANRDVIPDPKRMRAGIRVRIPDLEGTHR